MRQYYPLTVTHKRFETHDSVRLSLDVPEALRETFVFLPGQHLPVQASRDGNTLRRTYSVCSVPGVWPLEIGIRVQPGGTFSNYAANELSVGDQLEVMPPFGRFHADVDAANKKDYLAFAAGSGITPIISILRTVLGEEPHSRVALFYGNRKQATTMFIDDLYALKNQYPDRVQIHFVFSREDQEFPIAAGRLDRDKVAELYERFCAGLDPHEVFVCGPDSMIGDVTAALVGLGISAENIHAERYGAPKQRVAATAESPVADEATAAITVILDGHKKSFEMPMKPTDGDSNIVDAAADHGIELPYSCKGGVCATCRSHLRKGEVRMATNYALEPWEVEAGFVLACQSMPVSDEVVLDYDKT